MPGADADPHAGVAAGLPFGDFAAASQAVLQQLQEQLKLGLWMVTRVVGDEQVVLTVRHAADGSGYSLQAGVVLDWHESLCKRRVESPGPTIAPRVADVPAYADAAERAALALDAPVQAYVAVPLRQADGRLFGSLCAFDTSVAPHSLREQTPYVLLQARLLATVLDLTLEREQQQRRAERAETEATRDALTGLANRRAWDAVLVAEELRCQRYGSPACVVVLDLDGLKALNDTHGHAAGDALLRRTGALLTGASRSSDVVSRLGGDEFGVLVAEATAEGGRASGNRLREALRAGGVAASVGVGVRAPDGSLSQAWQDADAAMYREKRPRV